MWTTLLACNPVPPDVEVGPVFSLDVGASFWDAPFPSDHRLVGGAVDVSEWPNPDGNPFATAVLGELEGASGFSTTSAILFPSPVPLASVEIVLFELDDPDRTIPLHVAVVDDGLPYGPEYAAAALPIQGIPLAPDTTYAAVVTSAHTEDGTPFSPNPELGSRPDWQQAVAAHPEALAVTTFTTWDPTIALLDQETSAPPLVLEDELVWTETWDDFCVYTSTVSFPVFQEGDPPYLTGGGGWADEVQRWESGRIFVTVPLRVAPPDGFPVVVMSRTGGGGDRPLIDRGPRDATSTEVPGTGPAAEFAQVGWAGVTVDGPLGGLRNPTGGDEQFLIFNIGNPAAMRDNLRQSALELALLPELLDELVLDDPDCPGALDTDHLVLFGHSMGATIAPAAAAASSRYEAMLLSGAGGSWIENVLHKQSPLAVLPLAEMLVGYADSGHRLHEHDALLSLVQWAGEPADPPVYAHHLEDRHVLMMQGIVDTYILPPIANATSLSLALDLGGEALDAASPDLAAFTPLEEELHWTGGAVVPLPVSGNRDGFTRVVTQHLEDGIEDGHEVVFQTEGPKRQYRCFLATLAGNDAVASPAVPEVCP